VFLAITALFGVMHSWLALFGPVAIFMIGLMFSIIGLAFTAIVPLIDYFTYYWTLFITPMFLFSGVFFPLNRMPGWVQAVAWFVPLHQGVELMRALTLTGSWTQAAQSGAWILAVTAATFVLPLNLLRRRLIK